MPNIDYTNDVRKVMLKAGDIAERMGCTVSTEHILGAMFVVKDTYAYDILTQLKIDKEKALNCIAELRLSVSDQIIEYQVSRSSLLA